MISKAIQVYLTTFEISVLKWMSLILQKKFSAPGLAWQAALQKTIVKLHLLNDIDMLLIVEKGIRRGICHYIYEYEKNIKKYMKDYDKNKGSPFLQY